MTNPYSSRDCVIVASGMDYRYPALPGIEELWGNSVFHYPFCHGWEASERPLGVLGADAGAVHRALLPRAWSEDVTLLADGPAELDAGQRKQLADAAVEVDPRFASTTPAVYAAGDLALPMPSAITVEDR